MKPHLLKVAVDPQYSFSVRMDRVPYFYNRLHYHPEIELVYIHQGEGLQFIGNDVRRFAPGDMILVGSNLSHMWRCDEAYFLSNQQKSSEASVVHFHPHFMGSTFINLPENKWLMDVLKKAEQGLRIAGETKQSVLTLMKRLSEAKNAERVILLLLILQCIADSRQTNPITVTDYLLPHSTICSGKLNAVFEFVGENYQERITLKQVAAVANISPNAFCRYFKHHTQKTFSSFLIEVRLAHACKLLQEGDKAIFEVCYESGFNNISNFNRLFKKNTGKTPVKYKLENVYSLS